MTQIEIGSAAVAVALIIGTLMAVIGWAKLPNQFKDVAIAVVLMFIGYQVVEFILTSFISVAK